jgi:hypothetical protein
MMGSSERNDFSGLQILNTGKRVEFAEFSSNLPRYSPAMGIDRAEGIGNDGNRNLGAEEVSTAPSPIFSSAYG